MDSHDAGLYPEVGLIQIGKGQAPLTNNADFPGTNKDLPGLYLKTFGCQMNVYDTAKIETILANSYRPTSEIEDAKLIIVNTCSVREKAEHKLYSLVGSLKSLKEKDKDLLIGVGGCVAQQEGEKILKRSKEVDFVFGTHNLSLVPSLISLVRSGKGRQVAVDYRDEWEELPFGGAQNGRASVFVSISRGCNKNCTYCIVPTTRGKEVSRPYEEIIREVQMAAQRGAREVVLLGQTVNSYGLDLAPRIRFAELLDKISKVEGIARIRFTSPHPQEIRKDFYDLLVNNEKICRHVHMPLQSGSDAILKAMNRNYRKKRYLEIIRGLKEVCPEIGISTDLIVGFPGETDQDFRETLDVMKEVEFDSSFSFAYSKRPGTKAVEMDNQIAEEIKKERLQELQLLQDSITTDRLKRWIGREVEILIDGVAKSDAKMLQGRTSENVLVHLAKSEGVDTLEPGMIVNARVTRASKYTLHGEWTGSL